MARASAQADGGATLACGSPPHTHTLGFPRPRLLLSLPEAETEH